MPAKTVLLAALFALLLASGPAAALPLPGLSAVGPAVPVAYRHHHHRYYRQYGYPARGVDQFGYPRNDPQRPYGANNTITARPGTAGYREQQINRREFCDYAPSRC